MLSEVDIRDFERTKEVKRLYDVERNSVVSLKEEPEVAFNFYHVDGMFSYCTLLDGTLWHPAANSEVYLWKKNK